MVVLNFQFIKPTEEIHIPPPIIYNEHSIKIRQLGWSRKWIFLLTRNS